MITICFKITITPKTWKTKKVEPHAFNTTRELFPPAEVVVQPVVVSGAFDLYTYVAMLDVD